MSPALRLLAAARAASPDSPTGVARSGACVVTYYRARHTGGGTRLLTAATYDVGTSAVSIYGGRSSDVLLGVEAILAGNVTRETCDAWIADAPVRARAALTTGARLPAGTVRA